MKTNLTLLIERVETDRGANRETDLLIAQFIGLVPVGATYDPLESMAWHNRMAFGLPAYTRSYDAAVSLIPKGWILEFRRGFNSDGEYVSAVSLTDSFTIGRGFEAEDERTVSARIVERTQGVDPSATAITLASLRALESK